MTPTPTPTTITNGATGPHIKTFQRHLNRRLRARRLGTVPVDGVAGQQTCNAAALAGFWLGALEETCTRARKGEIGGGLRRIIEDPSSRNGKQNDRAAQRRKELGKRPLVKVLNVNVDNSQGSIGPLSGFIGHYTGGRRPITREDEIDLFTEYHREHADKGWGGIGYHYAVLFDGTILCLREAYKRGTHTAFNNTGRIGIVMHGSTGDKPNSAQQTSLRWLLNNAHTDAFPRDHRASAKLSSLHAGIHKEYNATSCPGEFARVYKSKGLQR